MTDGGGVGGVIGPLMTRYPITEETVFLNHDVVGSILKNLVLGDSHSKSTEN